MVSLFKCTDKKGECNSQSCCNDQEYRGQSKPSEEISADATSTITIPRRPGREGKEHIPDKNIYVGEVNIRRLKRVLRYHIPHLFSPQVLQVLEVHQPFSAWAGQGFGGKQESMTTSQWAEADLWRAIRQITGHAFGKSTIDLGDVYAVLLRAGLCKPVEDSGTNKKSPEGSKETVGDSDDKMATSEEKHWSERLKEIKSSADA